MTVLLNAFSDALVCVYSFLCVFLFFFSTHPATTEIYTLSLHDALPIWRWPDVHLRRLGAGSRSGVPQREGDLAPVDRQVRDRKSTRLNSSHANISYAVFCLKKKNNWARRQSDQPMSRWRVPQTCVLLST